MIENLGIVIDISSISDFKKKYFFHASVSHENDYAIAIVISELIN